MGEHLTRWLAENLAYVWCVCLGMWGGTASYLSRRRRNKSSFSFAEWLGECVISGLAGMITAYFCVEAGFSFPLTAALAGIAGHQGGRLLYLAEHRANRLLGLETSKEGDDYDSKY